MFMQQFCSVNVIAYYSSNIFDAGFSNYQAPLASWGFGMLNRLFAFPAVWTIDTFGRHSLLLTTFPLMEIFLLMTGFSFYIPKGKTQVAVVAVGIYLYTMAYSPGEGSVPFAYSAEAYPLYVRDVGMSFSTTMLWLLPTATSSRSPSRASAPVRCIQRVLSGVRRVEHMYFVAILLFVPVTKALSLEKLDQVFSVPTR
ncbi:uncharacterized protein FIBRA_04581 [Fibroporia radiculosa]|uniref:Major facilitator superfamily (MFS) profile domain-containing protein n=1 Tax=Fibroporia radiculosa TaxID=599839 RepID=J4IA87_9APHY|nr:uncharacterized protein FIBRA_04581 [Fibroporia radiculosa]CCM02481.1 predicted protein [Fibroporia radiculosa]